MRHVRLLVCLGVLVTSALGAGTLSAQSSPGNANQLRILTTIDKPDANNYGWVVINNTTKHWIDASCRVQLDQVGVTTSIAAWNAISAISDTTPRSCSELLVLVGGTVPDGPAVTRLVTTPDRANQADYGWVFFDNNTKQWIDSDCRAQLVSSGRSLVALPWSSISLLPDSARYSSCDELQGSVTTVNNDPPIIDNPTVPPVTPPVVPPNNPPNNSITVSYGDQDPPARTGPGWSAVDKYFAMHPRRPGECSQQIHDRYWAKGADGKIHPAWHPIRHPSGCSMAHDHGDDPRTSDLIDFSQGIPFAMTQGARGNQGAGGVNRHEDHVGHKVVVQNNWFVVNGDPQQGDKPDTGFITRTSIQCDWLSKLHQGSHSKDALGNNGHEYFLNVRCSDGLQLRLKTIVSFGPGGIVTDVCGANDEFSSGITGSNTIPVYNFLDGKREFNCIDFFLGEDLPEFKARRLEELWKPDGVIQLPSGGYINYSPYYVVFNPARYMDNTWTTRGASDSYISTVNLCFDDPGRNVARPVKPVWCDSVPQSVANTAADQRISHPDNPMNGSRRMVHPKGIQLDTLWEQGSSAIIRFCTNAFGQGARVLVNANENCQSDEIEQLVSRSKRGWGQNGSDVNSFVDSQGNLRGGGYLNEWIRDFSGDTSLRYPN